MRIGQTRKHSLLEAIINIAIGYWIAILTQVVTFPLFEIEASVSDNLAIGAVFTVVSLVRSYFLRRAFNWWHTR